MVKKVTITDRFPFGGLFIVIAIVLAVPLTVWSINNASTNIQQEAKGNSGGSSSISVAMVKDNNYNGLPNWNDTITFNVVTTQTNTPFVRVSCTKNDVLVYSASAGFYESYQSPESKNMPLSSPKWMSGGADCTATLDNSSQGGFPFAKLNFHVNP